MIDKSLIAAELQAHLLTAKEAPGNDLALVPVVLLEALGDLIGPPPMDGTILGRAHEIANAPHAFASADVSGIIRELAVIAGWMVRHPNPGDFRYWEGRYRDAAAEIFRLKDEIRQSPAAPEADEVRLAEVKAERDAIFNAATGADLRNCETLIAVNGAPLTPAQLGELVRTEVEARVQAALAAQGEPVAWMQRHHLGPVLLSHEDSHASAEWSAPFPVYEGRAPASAGVTVKPLVWENGHKFCGQDCSYADTEFGAYLMVAYSGRGGRWAHTDPAGNDSEDDWETRDECQAAANADYQARILAALSQPAQGVTIGIAPSRLARIKHKSAQGGEV